MAFVASKYLFLVRQKSCHLLEAIQPLIGSMIALGSLIYTDECNIYHRLTEWGYAHILLASRGRGIAVVQNIDEN